MLITKVLRTRGRAKDAAVDAYTSLNRAPLGDNDRRVLVVFKEHTLGDCGRHFLYMSQAEALQLGRELVRHGEAKL